MDTPGELNFLINNDQAYDLNLFWIDWNHNFRLYSTIPSGEMIFQQSYYNHVWVLSNAENRKCLVFKLGLTNLFMTTDQIVKVSDMTGDDCNPAEVPS